MKKDTEEPIERSIKERIYLFVGEHKVLAVITVSIITFGLGATAVFRIRVHMAHYPKDESKAKQIIEDWASTEKDFETAEPKTGTIGSIDIFHGWYADVEMRTKRAVSSVYESADQILNGLKGALERFRD